MDDELDEPLAELARCPGRVEVEEADQVDEQERAGEGERDELSGERPVRERDPVGRERAEEEQRQEVGERQRAADLPVHLLERDAEERREEEDARHLSDLASTRASSSARVPIESRVAAPSGAASRPACRPASARAGRASRVAIAVDVVGRDDDAGAGLAHEVGGGAVRRDGGEDRALGGEVLEDLPGRARRPRPRDLGDEQEERLGVALELERAAARDVRDELEPVAEPERLGPLAVGRAEVADEAGDRVEVGLGERGQERPRVALAEEAPVCVIRKRSAGRYSRPAKSSKSQPFGIVTRAARIERSTSSAIASATATIASA